MEVIHRLWDASYNEPFEEYLSEAGEPDVTLTEPLRINYEQYEAGAKIGLIDLLKGLDEDLDSYRLWSKPQNRIDYPYATEYEDLFGPDVEATLAEIRRRYTAHEAGQEALRYYQAHKWLEENGIGDRW
jgi:hypothetical protein